MLDSAPFALVCCEFPPGTPAGSASTMLGLLRWRGGMRLVVKVEHAGVTPPPERIESWALTLGDLELV